MKRKLDSRTVAFRSIALLATGVFLSAARYNPWVDHMLKGAEAIDRADVVGQYAVIATAIGAAWLLLGLRVARGPSRADGLVMAMIILTAPVLLDRLLLARNGLPLWKYDPELRYAHRPGAVRLVRRGGGAPPDEKDLVVIDRFGFHDRGVTLEKPPGQLRILLLGDSVTMGYGVTYDETFAKHLEDLLERTDSKHASHEAIDAGVHGYSTFQERIVLERTLRFRPDLVVVGFCLNDVTEPFVVDTAYGGTGLDYHEVSQVPNPIAGWIANETGFGRWVQRRAQAGKTLAAEKRLEVYNVRSMAERSRTAPEFIEAWKITLAEMDRLFATARKAGVPAVIAVFPFLFQLGHPELLEPQRIIGEYAAKEGIDLIDLTPVLERAVLGDPAEVAGSAAKGLSREEIERRVAERSKRYFFDEDHLTGAGHLLVAERLLEYLVAKGFASGAKAGGAGSADPMK